MIEITNDTVREGLTALVEEFGEDFVYSKGEDGLCRYVRNGQPDCIVGKFLAAQGVPVERLAESDGTRFGTVADQLLGQLEGESVITVSDGARATLEAVQHYQDSGFNWGYSVENALDWLA